jgi:DNA-binding XRE family transcriptional regulator
MRHRHLEIRSGTPAEELPPAAIVDILARGDLADWKPIAEAIDLDPQGKLADMVMRLVDVYPMYGTSALWRAWIDRTRARAEGARRPVNDLPALRRGLGFTQVKLADRVGMSQSDLSKLERRRDVRLSTLRAYAVALGGRLRMVFDIGGKQTEIRLRNEGDGHRTELGAGRL